MDGFAKVLQSFALLIARLGLGGILLAHGYTHWRGPGQGLQKQVDVLTAVSAPYPEVGAWAIIIFELLGGVLLIIGALTRFVGFGVVVLSALTIAYLNWYKSFNLVNPDGSFNGGYEYDVALGVLGLLLFVFGGGAVALDRLFTRKKTETAAEGEADDKYAGSSVIRAAA